MPAGVPSLWRTADASRGGSELLIRVLSFLDGADVVRLLAVEQRCRTRIAKLVKRFQRGRARLALAMWCFSRLRVEFQAYYQELDTLRIPRANDPRVPPRVISFWTEKGKPTQRPMLTNVVQTQRRIYTVVTVKLLERDDNEGGRVLRQSSYLKEFGEWKTPTIPEKRRLAAASSGSRQARYDLVSQDGSIALELDVPAGTDAQTDYYLVKQTAVSLHMQELLQHHFQSLRPIRSLPEPARPEACTISVTFRTIEGKAVSRCCVAGNVVVERQDGEGAEVSASPSTATEAAAADGSVREQQQQLLADPARASPRQLTGVERFEVVTCRADCGQDSSGNGVKLALPSDPGYVWLEVRGMDASTSFNRSTLYFYAVALHHGAQQESERGELRSLQCNWLPGVLESFPTPESRRRRCLKGSLRVVTESTINTLQDLALVAQRLPSARLERYAARIESYTRHEASSNA
ncbi:hypothetical protein BBJ28_00009171 [Nothophytophthora sp. Chile5]|nr:hypothetical protein BBJ28_00009171 [Nothophytophthora sp. Chile5]